MAMAFDGSACRSESSFTVDEREQAIITQFGLYVRTFHSGGSSFGFQATSAPEAVYTEGGMAGVLTRLKNLTLDVCG